MDKYLFLICPLDFLEKEITKQFGNECLFFSSLGLSFNTDSKEFDDLIEIIVHENITHIKLVISKRNKIISSSLNTFETFTPSVLRNHQLEILGHKWKVLNAWKKCNVQHLVSSNLLAEKQHLIQQKITEFLPDHNIDIESSLFDPDKNEFQNQSLFNLLMN